MQQEKVQGSRLVWQLSSWACHGFGLVRSWTLERKPSWIGMMASHIFSCLPTLEATERIDLFDRLQVGARWNVDFIILICLSTAIAEALVPPLATVGIALAEGV